jgi:hypothetical protein
VSWRRIPRAVTSLAIACLVACGNASRPEPAVAAPVPGREAPLVEFAGCSGATKAPQPLRCTLPAAKAVIRLFVSASSVPVIELDGVPAKAFTRPAVAERGWTTVLEVPPDAATLSVRYADAGPTDASWTMTLDRLPPTPTVDAIEARVPKMNAPGRTPALLAIVEELQRALPALQGYERHRALKLATVFAMHAGKAQLATEIGLRGLREALDASELPRVIDIGEVVVHATSDVAERDWIFELLRIAVAAAGDGLAETRLLYIDGAYAQDRGDIGEGIEAFARSEAIARRLGLVNEELSAAAKHVAALGLVGDSTSAQWEIDRMLVLLVGRAPEQACYDAATLLGAAWNPLTRRTLGEASADPTPMLRRIAAYFERGGGCDVGDNPVWRGALGELRLDVVRSALAVHDVVTAQDELLRLEVADLLPDQRRWYEFVHAELALRSGDTAATLRGTEKLDLTSTGLPLLAWKAALLRAEAHIANGDDGKALAEALVAESVLDRASSELAFDQGREGMAATFGHSAAQAIELQLRKNDVAAAVATARKARARRLRPVGSVAAIAQLDPATRTKYQAARGRARERSMALADDLTRAWRLPAEERVRSSREHVELREGVRTAMKEADAILREASPTTTSLQRATPGELTLLFHPLPKGWVAFAIGDSSIEVHRFELPALTDDAAMSAAMLATFADAIGRARLLRVLAVGEVSAVRVHALPWGGKPLMLATPVVYGLDLESSAAEASTVRSALIVADPATRIPGLGRLPNAAIEGQAVQRQLEALGWQARILSGEDATHQAVLDALDDVGWLHYAGHGTAVGHSGWQSALPLAGEARLDVADILASPTVPPSVVLSACETAGTSDRKGASMQLASAFLLAGAEVVVAAQDGVQDSDAAKFSAALYEAMGADLRGPELVRRAVAVLVERGEPMSTWSGFHVWVR